LFSEKNTFGTFTTVELKDTISGTSAEIALKGATLLNYFVKTSDGLFNIVDGFKTPEELIKAKGARCYIMAPFANRIPEGKFFFEGKSYVVSPVPPRTEVIHGFTASRIFGIEECTEEDDFVSITLVTDIAADQYAGYPFSFKVSVKYTLTEDKLDVVVTGLNTGENAAPFFCGWHPYFKTGENGIENLVLTINAKSVIAMDEKYIPLKGAAAYSLIEKHKNVDYRPKLSEDERTINGRTLDLCYANLEFDEKGYACSSIYDPSNGLKVTMYQKGGVTLAFSGDSLNARKRKAVALEPMMAITNSYNREDFKQTITVLPGASSSFNFGVKAECLKK
jgi:aldose 1-epimerase